MVSGHATLIGLSPWSRGIGVTRRISVPRRGASHEDGAYHAIYATLDLGWPVAPYGMVSGTCEHCGSVAPRFNFYPCFEKPSTPCDWMTWPVFGPSRLLVSGRVYRWLRTEGRAFMGQRADGQALGGWRCGWYPDDAERAFLPEAYHGSAPAQP